jgi:hypothetical protein
MTAYLKIATASALALATAAPSYAQYYRETPQSAQAQRDYQYQQQQYEQQRQDYQASRDTYDARRSDYQDARADYREARAAYERRLADWERARISYDARWGYGAYARRYARPVWDESRWASRDPAPYAGGRYGYNASANVRCNSNSTVGAGVVGALLGGILGSNVAGRGDRTEGTVLGALVGGGLGAAVGNANDRYRCDSRGPYFAYSQTLPYRESRSWRYGENDYGYYTRQRCRLAPAPVDSYGREYRYVRVCPDASGRYRITG